MILDALDVRLLALLSEHPRIGVLELSRLAGVARGTVTARMQRWSAAGIVTGYGAQVALQAAGFGVQAVATRVNGPGAAGEVARFLTALPGVTQAHATTGSGDVVCHLAAASNASLQQLLLQLSACPAIRRSTSVVILSTVVAPRVLPLLAARYGIRAGQQ